MARLRKHSSLSTSTLGEAATQQLRTSSDASRDPPAPLSSAVVGASLLNAARSDKPEAGTVKGKLSRPNTVSGIRRKQLARQVDLYDILDSPERGAFQLPETVNPAPLRILKRQKRSKGDTVAPSEEYAEQQDPQSKPVLGAEDEDEQCIPISPPVFADDNASPAASNERPRPISLDSGDRSALSTASLPNEVASRTTQSKRKFEAEIDQGNTNPKSPRLHGSDTSELPNRKKMLRTGRRRYPEVRIPVRIPVRRINVGTSSLQAAADQHLSPDNQQGDDADTIVVAVPEPSTADNQGKSRHQATQVSASTSRRSRSTGDQTGTTPTGTAPTRTTPNGTAPTPKSQEDVLQNTDHGGPVLGDDEDNQHVGDHNISGDEQESHTSQEEEEEDYVEEAIRDEDYVEEATRDEEEVDTEEEEEEVDTDKASKKKATLSDLDQVFKFLDFEECPDKCQTNLGAKIERICQRSCAEISGENDSFDVVIENTVNVRAALKEISNLEEPKHLAFKSDAYSYLFRSIILYLETVFDWLSEKYDQVKESLIAMQILYPLVKDTVMFKDKMATWKVSVPQRYKGERLIKNVESELIVPLRKVEQEFRNRLRQLEAADKIYQMRLDLKCKQEEKIARQNYLAARNKRRQHWQDLHIARMQCEPDLLKRRKLFFTELDDLEETDANGVKFERMPLFKDRVTPRPTSSASEQREWDDEQTTVLIKALEKFAGPRVFEKLFHAHCRPGGVLRDFTVPDIAAKAAWVRSAYLKFHQLQQDKGWEVPDWVKQIPILP